MAVRRESVRLSLEDDFTSKMARAAAATSLLNKELNGLDGKRVSREMDDTSRGVDKIGGSTRRAGPDIDKFSGRLRLLTDAAVTVGPIIAPLGAATIPVLTGALAGLGAAAGGIGAAVLAFQGLGDALTAIDKAHTEPTAENLLAMRVELEKLGPAGAEFARYLDDLRPTLSGLQNTAREGIFPGVEAGIDDLLTRLPQVQRIIEQLSTGMGDLAADAGASLAGDKFSAFFDYIETDAKPTLESFGHSLGNVAEGISNLLVGFAPLSRDFTGGLEDATAAFAKWSRGLDDNASFQDLVDYVRKSGPQAVEALSAVAQAFAGLLEAAAPVGSAVLPVITAMARVFGAIAKSPIGPVLYGAVAGFVAINRVATITSKGLDRVTASSEKTRTSFSKYAALGGGVIGVGMAVGALADNINRIDPENLDRNLTALSFGDVTDDINKVVDSIGGLESKWNSVDLGKVITVGGLFGASTSDRWKDNIDQVDKALANLVESGNADQAAALFQKINDLASAKGVDPSATKKRFDDYSLALKNAAAAAANGSGSVDQFGNAVAGAAGDMDAGTTSAQRFSGALSELNGWFDRRQALRDYKDSLRDLGKSLKNGFQRKDVENLDAAGRSILQVAEGMKDPQLRRDFLATARASLVELADHAGPKAQAAIQQVINQFDAQGLTKPHLIPLSVDDKASPTLDDLGIHLRRTGNITVKPKVSVDPGNSLGIIGQIAAAVNSLHDKSVTVRVNRIGGVTSHAGGRPASAPTALLDNPPPAPNQNAAPELVGAAA